MPVCETAGKTSLNLVSREDLIIGGGVLESSYFPEQPDRRSQEHSGGMGEQRCHVGIVMISQLGWR